jgi:hypothetical protein
MASLLFIAFFVFALAGAPQIAGYALAGALMCVFGWLLFGPGGRWL